MEYQRETEVKFCLHNLSHLEIKLHELKAHLLAPRTFEVNLRFDTPSGDLTRAGRVLRLRKDNLARLTYKDNSQLKGGAITRQRNRIRCG